MIRSLEKDDRHNGNVANACLRALQSHRKNTFDTDTVYFKTVIVEPVSQHILAAVQNISIKLEKSSGKYPTPHSRKRFRSVTADDDPDESTAANSPILISSPAQVGTEDGCGNEDIRDNQRTWTVSRMPLDLRKLGERLNAGTMKALRKAVDSGREIDQSIKAYFNNKYRCIFVQAISHASPKWSNKDGGCDDCADKRGFCVFFVSTIQLMVAELRK